MDLVEQRIKAVIKDLEPVLDLSFLNLEYIPVIPEHVKILYLSHNKLTSLSELPLGLLELYIDNNLLIKLPELPNTLEILSCERNKLKQLPVFPESLIFLDCRYNYFEYEPIFQQECKIYYYPQENDIMEIEPYSKNILSSDDIISGNILVDYENESKYKRYYKKSTFDTIKEPKINPFTRNPIIDKKMYIARVVNTRKTNDKKSHSLKKLRSQR
jgi:Leucine-rich repeat (LRR) protein